MFGSEPKYYNTQADTLRIINHYKVSNTHFFGKYF